MGRSDSESPQDLMVHQPFPSYPVFLHLAGVAVLVVGGGSVALRKTQGLIHGGAVVTVVAPSLCPEFHQLPSCHLVCRPFHPNDVAGHRLAFAATNDPEVNATVVEACRDRDLWVCNSGAGHQGDLMGALALRRGPITLAVSTDGLAPGLAPLWRSHGELLLDLLGAPDGMSEEPAAAEAWSNLARLRNQVRNRTDLSPQERREILRAAAVAWWTGSGPLTDGSAGDSGTTTN